MSGKRGVRMNYGDGSFRRVDLLGASIVFSDHLLSIVKYRES